jgi:hypothetical protein
MSAFEFFTVLLSFVVSLGVASLLHAVIRLAQEGGRVQFSLTWALWAAAIFNLQITFWLKSWSYHEHYMLKTTTSIPPLVLAIIAFLSCGLATPHIPDEGPIDLRAFHAAQGRKYQIAYAVFMLVAIVQAGLMQDMADASSTSTFVPDAAILAGLALAALLAAVFQAQRWIQAGVPAIFLLSAVAFYGRLMEQ